MVVKDDNLDRADFGGEKNRKEHTIVFEKETFFSLAKVGRCETVGGTLTLTFFQEEMQNFLHKHHLGACHALLWDCRVGLLEIKNILTLTLAFLQEHR